MFAHKDNTKDFSSPRESYFFFKLIVYPLYLLKSNY